MVQERPSVYNVGAADGMIMGIYLSLMFLLQSLGTNNLMLTVLGDIMMLAVPVLAYVLLKRGYQRKHRYQSFSAIWLHGIIMFLCGGLLLAAVVYVFLRFIQPRFIYEQLTQLIEIYKGFDTPEAESFVDIFQQMIDQKLLPSPIQIAFGLIWLVGFSGAVLSCLLAFIIKLSDRLRRRPDVPNLPDP